MVSANGEMSKEGVYDREIAPLMTRIIEICQREKIAFLADFRIPSLTDPDLHCTTAMLSDEYEPTKEQRVACDLLMLGFTALLTRRREKEEKP